MKWYTEIGAVLRETTNAPKPIFILITQFF